MALHVIRTLLLEFGFIFETQPLLSPTNSFSKIAEAVVRRLFLKVSQNSQENTIVRASFSIKLQASTCNFIEKETLAQVFSCEFCEILKKTFLTDNLQWLLYNLENIVSQHCT